MFNKIIDWLEPMAEFVILAAAFLCGTGLLVAFKEYVQWTSI